LHEPHLLTFQVNSRKIPSNLTAKDSKKYVTKLIEQAGTRISLEVEASSWETVGPLLSH